MIPRIRIQNYRCFRELDVELRPLTVLIGQNNTGKSAFLSAIRVATGSGQFNPAEDTFHKNGSLTLEIRLIRSGNIPLAWARHDPKNGKQGGIHDNGIRAVGWFQLPVTGVRLTCPGISDRQARAPAIESDGGNVAALLDYMLRRDRAQFDRFVEMMRAYVPGLADLHPGTPDPAHRTVDVKFHNGLVVEEERLSAGLKILLFYTSIAFHPDPPRVIMIEEPETGLHPKRLGDVMNLLRGITEGKLAGHKAQVIITTHSPYLLDYVNLETDQVLVFRRQDDGSCIAEPANRELLQPFLKDFMLGEVWYDRDDEGLLRSAQG